MARKDNKKGFKLWCGVRETSIGGSQGGIHKGIGRGGYHEHMAPNRRVGKEGNTVDGQLASGDLFWEYKKVR